MINPAAIQGIRAVLFDMDGTLILSEDRTEYAVATLLTAHGIDPDPETLESFHGITWETSARHLEQRWPRFRSINVVPELQRLFHASFADDPPPQVPGAREALLAAAALVPTAIVTSSNRETLDLVCAQLDLVDTLTAAMGAEDYTGSKPSPEPYLAAASRLEVAPEQCLVFEDSAPGIQAAVAAGATVIAIGNQTSHEPWIKDYNDLPRDFFARATRIM